MEKIFSLVSAGTLSRAVLTALGTLTAALLLQAAAPSGRTASQALQTANKQVSPTLAASAPKADTLYRQVALTVTEYRPAPGQFINTAHYSGYQEGADEEAVRSAVQDSLNHSAAPVITLGAWGGYITVRTLTPIKNHPGKADLVVLGNAHSSSSEPGVISVSCDVNANGLPDDPWYEIKGSEWELSTHGYALTYYRPADYRKENIPWSDNQGAEGEVPRNQYHAQPYWPLWIDRDELTFTGTALPGTAQGYVLNTKLDYGYADNQENNHPAAAIDLDWAVSPDGSPASVEQIDFIRVHTGLNAQMGVLGECSTEFCGVKAILWEESPSRPDDPDEGGETPGGETPIEAVSEPEALQIMATAEEVEIRTYAALGSVVLFRSDGTVVAQAPFINGRARLTGLPPAQGPEILLIQRAHLPAQVCKIMR